MNRKQAADFLKVSEKTISRNVASGKLPSHYVEGKSGRELDLSEADLIAFRDGTSAGRDAETGQKRAGETAAIVPVNPTPLTLENMPLEQLLRAIIAETLAARQDVSHVPISSKTLLTLDEAAALTGVPRSILNQARKDEKLRAFKIGRAFRVGRTEAETFALSLVE